MFNGVNQKFLEKNIRLIIIAIPIVIAAGLIYRFFAPFGAEVKYTYSLKNNPEIMSDLKPIEEVNFLVKEGNNYLQIPEFVMRNNKVQFSLKLPTKEVKQANVKMRFKSDDNDELKVGLRSNPKENFQYKILDNKILGNLTWERNQEGNLCFWQKYKNYDSIQELIDRPSKDQVISQYLYDINQEFKIKDYQKSDEEFVIDSPLRGSHTFYTYIKNEVLDFTIEKQDRNVYKGKDELEINVFKGREKIYSLTIEDDGIVDKSGNKKQPQIAHIEIPDLKEGVYKIQLLYKGTGDDSLITKISTNQHLLVFEKKMFILGNEPSTIWTNSKEINAQTYHSESCQTLKINDTQDLEIKERAKTFTAAMDKNLNKIYSPKNDIIITSDDGYFSFTPESFFNPRPYNTVEFHNDIDLETVDYIIADYTKPKNINGWLENEVSFDISDMEIIDNTLRFVLEAPGLKADNGEIIIDLIEVSLMK